MAISYPEVNSSSACRLRQLSSEEAGGPLSQGSFGAGDIAEETKHTTTTNNNGGHSLGQQKQQIHLDIKQVSTVKTSSND